MQMKLIQPHGVAQLGVLSPFAHPVTEVSDFREEALMLILPPIYKTRCFQEL